MDNFMSKLSQKINAQDSIKANFMAEAAEKEQMKKQLTEYESIIQSVHSLCRKQEANNAVFQELLQKLEETTNAQPAGTEDIKDYIAKSDEFTHRECVKVYRNVQALLEEQDKKLENGLADLRASTMETLEEMQLHTGSGINRLRNQLEASQIPDLTPEVDELKRLIKKQNRGNKTLLWLTFALALANIGLVLLIHFGFFGWF